MTRLGLYQIGSLGDCLFLTAGIQALRDKGEEVIVEMHPDTQCRQVSKVFDGLASVEFKDNPLPRLYITNTKKVHSSLRVLQSLGLENYSCIPKINLRQEEIDWAKNYLGEYDISRTIILVNDNQGANQPTNYCAQYKRPPIELMQYVTDYLIGLGYTVLQFGPKLDRWVGNIPTFTPLKGAFYIRDLEIREQAACFSIIKKMFTGCTGLLHLALAVGAKIVCFHPPNNDQFQYYNWDLHYLPELWKGPIRAKYVDFTKFDGNLAPLLDFLNT